VPTGTRNKISPLYVFERPCIGALRLPGCTQPSAIDTVYDRPSRAIGVVLALALALPMAACAGEEPSIDQLHFSIAEPGPWHIPLETLAIGDTQEVPYTGAGPWIGEQGCGGQLLAGTSLLRDYVYLYFPQAYSIGGYSCRPIVGNSSAMSVHATGRALDIMIETLGGEADNSAGDPIGNWLIENAELIGIQMIIWDRWLWRADRAPPKDKAYTGQHPHHDHLHVELSTDAASLLTPFFQNPMQPPDLVSCGTVPPEGGIIDDSDTCAGFYGPREYWRSADGAGHGGSLLWTNAFHSDQPSNWARWTLDVAEAGRYRADVYLTPEYSRFDRVRYEVAHAGEVTVLQVDQRQATAAGWYSIGAFDFAAGAGQHVSLFDNIPEAVADNQSIAFDALRLTPCSGSDCDESGDGSLGDGSLGDGSPDDGSLGGGCAAGGSPRGSFAALFVLLVVTRVRRRWRRHSRPGPYRLTLRVNEFAAEGDGPPGAQAIPSKRGAKSRV
jgi:hypothetical protein